MLNNIYIIIFSLTFLLLCPTNSESKKMEIKVSSNDFQNGGSIPSLFTCEGKNISPQISWANYPKNTKSFALIADDPDAPMGTWVHWIVYNIPNKTNELKQNFPLDKEFSNGIKQGMTDFGKTGFGGPCPPSGVHRYFFKVYALDTILDVPYGLTKKYLLEAMEGHILAHGQIMGKYRRNK